MDNLFGSETRRSLLTTLLMNPNRSFHIRELSEETKIPYSMVHREVINLIELELLTPEQKGNLKILHVNKNLPIYPDLRNIIIKTTGFNQLIKQEITGDLAYMLVFGSTASHKDRINGDIDLMIIGNLNQDQLLESINRVEQKTNRNIDYIHWTPDIFQEKVNNRNHILKSIVEGRIIMLEGDEDEFRRTVKRGLDP